MSRSRNQPAAGRPGASSNWKDRLPTEDYQELKNTFEVFDDDHSGFIDPIELTKVLEEIRPDDRNPVILPLIEGLKGKNKSLNFNEFLDCVCSKVGQTKTKDGLKKVFGLFDTNEDGVIDFAEFKAIFKQLHENYNDDELLEMLHSTHVNKKTGTNEHITFEEFYAIVAKYNK